MPSFLKELRRRNVIKVGLAYLALAWLADLMAEQSVATGTMANWTAMRYAHAGNDEKVIEWLERAFEQSDPNAPYLRVPEFDALHSDPRVRELLRRLGI